MSLLPPRACTPVRLYACTPVRLYACTPVRLRVDANVCGFACGYVAVCLLRPLWLAQGAIQVGCGVRLSVKGCRNAASTHETISSSIEAPLLMSGVSCVQHRFRLRQYSDASSHSSDSTQPAPNSTNLINIYRNSSFHQHRTGIAQNHSDPRIAAKSC